MVKVSRRGGVKRISTGCLLFPAHQAILVSSQNNPMGFVLFRKAADEAEIFTICTRPAFRQKGHGKLLMQHLESILKNGRCKIPVH